MQTSVSRKSSAIAARSAPTGSANIASAYCDGEPQGSVLATGQIRGRCIPGARPLWDRNFQQLQLARDSTPELVKTTPAD